MTTTVRPPWLDRKGPRVLTPDGWRWLAAVVTERFLASGIPRLSQCLCERLTEGHAQTEALFVKHALLALDAAREPGKPGSKRDLLRVMALCYSERARRAYLVACLRELEEGGER